MHESARVLQVALCNSADSSYAMQAKQTLRSVQAHVACLVYEAPCAVHLELLQLLFRHQQQLETLLLTLGLLCQLSFECIPVAFTSTP